MDHFAERTQGRKTPDDDLLAVLGTSLDDACGSSSIVGDPAVRLTAA